MFIKKIEQKNFHESACNLIKNKLNELLSQRPIVNVALSGGRTPVPILKLLSLQTLDWERINFFQTDERLVPLDHKENNFRTLSDVFLKHVDSTKFPMYSGTFSTQASCKNYANELNKINQKNKIPYFDLILLGMGEDGHIASLFPGSNLLEEKENWVAIDPEKRNGTPRMTLTFPVLFNAGDIVLIISGLSKIGLVESETARHALPIDTLIKRTENLTILCMEEK